MKKTVLLTTAALVFAVSCASADDLMPGQPETKAPIGVAPFPDRISAYVWRNWFVVPVERLAAVVGATPAELKEMLVLELVTKGHNAGLTDEEALLWPNDHEQAMRVRRVIPLFDQLGAEGLKGKMDSGLVIEFLKWCKVESKLEKQLYQYFCQAYKEQGGRLQPLGWSSVCQVRKDRREQHISDEEQAESFERRLAAIA